MSVFVNYGGPKLDKTQKRVVRSRAMVSARKEAKMKNASKLVPGAQHGKDFGRMGTAN